MSDPHAPAANLLTPTRSFSSEVVSRPAGRPYAVSSLDAWLGLVVPPGDIFSLEAASVQ